MCAEVAVLVMAKAPEPGRVKTRLCPPLDPVRACEFHTALLLDTLALVRRVGGIRLLAYSGPRSWFDCHAPDFECFEQCGNDLGERLDHALGYTLSRHSPVLCIGSDSPHLNMRLFARAADLLDTHPVVLGPARDGGYYLVGLRNYQDLFRGMPMSTDRLLAATLERCAQLNLEVGLLAEDRDCDTWADVMALRGHLGEGHTGRLLALWEA